MGLVFLVIFAARLFAAGAVHAGLDEAWSLPDIHMSNMTDALEGLIQTASSQIKLLRHEDVPHNSTEEKSAWSIQSDRVDPEQNMTNISWDGRPPPPVPDHVVKPQDPQADDELKSGAEELMKDLNSRAKKDVDAASAQRIVDGKPKRIVRTAGAAVDQAPQKDIYKAPAIWNTDKTPVKPVVESTQPNRAVTTTRSVDSKGATAPPSGLTGASNTLAAPSASGLAGQTAAASSPGGQASVEARLEALESQMKLANARVNVANARAESAEKREANARQEVIELKKALAGATMALTHDHEGEGMLVAPKGWTPKDKIVPFAVPRPGPQTEGSTSELKAANKMGYSQGQPAPAELNPDVNPIQDNTNVDITTAKLTGASENVQPTFTPAPTPKAGPQEYSDPDTGRKSGKTTGMMHDPVTGTWSIGKTNQGSPNDWGAWTWLRSPDGDYQLVWVKANNFHKWLWKWPGRFQWSGPHRRRGTWQTIAPDDWAADKHDLHNHMWEQGPPPHPYSMNVADAGWSNGMELPKGLQSSTGLGSVPTPAPRAMPTAPPKGWVHTTPKPGSNYVDMGRAQTFAPGKTAKQIAR